MKSDTLCKTEGYKVRFRTRRRDTRNPLLQFAHDLESEVGGIVGPLPFSEEDNRIMYATKLTTMKRESERKVEKIVRTEKEAFKLINS